MLQGFRSRYGELITSVSHLALLVLAFHIGDQVATVFIVGLIGVISFFAWASNFKRTRLIADTPTSRIGSAAQGYVELHGSALLDPENLIRSPISGRSCVWYRFQTFVRQHDRKWARVNEGISDSVFEISDGTGRCFIDPDHAEVIGAEKHITYQGQYKNVEELLYAPSVYALGEFSTLGGANSPLNLKEDVTALLAEWKRDKARLHQRLTLMVMVRLIYKNGSWQGKPQYVKLRSSIETYARRTAHTSCVHPRMGACSFSPIIRHIN